MNYITTTELRTKSKDILKALEEGHSIDLIHRSRIVGEIRPKIEDPKPFNTSEAAKIAERMNLPHLSPKQIEARYRAAMNKKHGKGLS